MKLKEFIKIQLDEMAKLPHGNGKIRLDIAVDEKLNVGVGPHRIKLDINVVTKGILLHQWQFTLLMSASGGLGALVASVVRSLL